MSTHNCSDHAEHDDDAPEWAVLPEGECPFSAASEKPEERSQEKPKSEPKAEVSPKPEQKAKPDKGKRLSIPEQMEKFRQRCVESGISDDKDLYATLSTSYRSTLEVKQIVSDFKASMGVGARGLTKDGENELVQRITRQAEMSMRDSMAKHRIRLNWWTSAAVGVLCVLCVSGGAVAGYWVGRDAGQASVHQVARDVAVAFSHGPDEASAVAQLLRHNDLSQMLAECHPFVADGRKACSGAWWMEPAPAAPGTAK